MKLDKNVVKLGLVSLFTDLSSQMVYPLVPLFLVSTLHASNSLVGLIEGVADGTASLVRMVGGLLSDRYRKRKVFVFIGYGLSTIAKPFLFLANHWGLVFAVRFADRVGKGIRTPARDALIADSVEPGKKGYGFGLHRGMDRLGGAGGPLLAMLVLSLTGDNLRAVFLLSVIPAAIAVALIGKVREIVPSGVAEAGSAAASGVRGPAGEARAPGHDGQDSANSDSPAARSHSYSCLGTPFRLFVLSVIVFTLGNSSNAFLILKAREAGLSAAGIPLIWLTYNVVCSLSSPVFGRVSDRIGQRPVIFLSFLVYAAIYTGFGLASSLSAVWVLFACYGLYYGLSEGVFRAYIADLVGSERRATAFGFFNTAVGVTLIPASIIFGALWDRVNSTTAFLVAASLSLAAAILFGVTQMVTSRKA
ncbi:MAG: MFS transporter [Candidatus Eisenbacteria bacterium]